MSNPPPDAHEWLSFDDAEDRRTWVVDLTFLSSSWTCIFGRGCQGVLDHPAADLGQGCCSHGAHLTDDEDLERVTQAVAELGDEDWQFRSRARARTGSSRPWAKAATGGGEMTRSVDGACIFLNRRGFAGGEGCAFHVLAERTGQRPMDLKPNVCWQLPLHLSDHVDEHGHTTSTLREWKRRDWGPAGEDFHWWCTEEPTAHIGTVPVVEALRDEIVELIGADNYDVVARHLASPRAVPLPHPVLRRAVEN